LASGFIHKAVTVVMAIPEFSLMTSRPKPSVSGKRAAGKAAGILVERDDVARYRDRGAQFLYAHANAFLSHGAEDFADLFAKR
jgi:2-keto-3-deoxy-L-rhamnonate aldolase RhmA